MYLLQFALLLTLALILEISASIAAYAMRTNIALLLNDKMTDTIKMYSNDSESKAAFDFVQKRVSKNGFFY